MDLIEKNRLIYFITFPQNRLSAQQFAGHKKRIIKVIKYAMPVLLPWAIYIMPKKT